MGLAKLLAQNKDAIIKDWFEMVIRTYAPETAQFLKNQKDAFANPVGNTILQGLKGLYDQLHQDIDHGALKLILDPIIRIRAVQAFDPSQALSFIFDLKQTLRTHLNPKLVKARVPDAIQQLDFKLDQIGLIAFDLYMECREKVYQIKANESKDRTLRAFVRAGLITEISEKGPDPNMH
jgi:hypothetical protein